MLRPIGHRPPWVPTLLVVALTAASASAMPAAKKSTEEQAALNVQKSTARYNEGTERMRRADSLLAAQDTSRARTEYEQAIQRFTEAVDLNPEFPEAWNNLGYSLRLTGRYEEALKHYDRAIQLKPDYMQAHEYRARAYLALGQIEDANKEHAFLLEAGHKEEAAELRKTIDEWVLAKAQGRKVGVEKNVGW